MRVAGSYYFISDRTGISLLWRKVCKYKLLQFDINVIKVICICSDNGHIHLLVAFCYRYGKAV